MASTLVLNLDGETYHERGGNRGCSSMLRRGRCFEEISGKTEEVENISDEASHDDDDVSVD